MKAQEEKVMEPDHALMLIFAMKRALFSQQHSFRKGIKLFGNRGM